MELSLNNCKNSHQTELRWQRSKSEKEMEMERTKHKEEIRSKFLSLFLKKCIITKFSLIDA